MFAYLRKPHPDLAAVVLRLFLGYLFIAYGCVKIDQSFTWTEVISPSMQKVVGWAELSFGILLVLGLLSRLAALGVIGVMFGAIYLVTGRRGLFPVDMGPHGFTFKASGVEYNMLIIAVCLTLLLLGSGWFSLDHLIFGCKKARTAAAGAPLPPSGNAMSPTIEAGGR